jgi:hypothetical protein
MNASGVLRVPVAHWMPYWQGYIDHINENGSQHRKELASSGAGSILNKSKSMGSTSRTPKRQERYDKALARLKELQEKREAITPLSRKS